MSRRAFTSLLIGLCVSGSALGEEPLLDLSAIQVAMEEGRYPQAMAALENRAAARGVPPEKRAHTLLLAGIAGVHSGDRERTDRGITLLAEAARLEPALREEALYFQAYAKWRLEQPREALTICENLSDRPGRFGARASMLAGMIILTGGAEEGADPAEAARRFQAVGLDPKCPVDLRIEALARETHAHRCADSWAAGLAAARTCLELALIEETEAGHWPQAAAWEAAQIAAAQQAWREAVDWMEQAAALPGPLKVAAQREAERWRLVHFIWEEESPATPSRD